MSYQDLSMMAAPSTANPNEPSPMSRTHQYRKVMKPLLERKRRARINKCLDEIKDILVEAMQNEGESIAKLEKADVLELTLKHLQKLKSQKRLVPSAAKPRTSTDIAQTFHTGYKACVNQVSQYLHSNPGPHAHQVGAPLMLHLAENLKNLEMRNQETTQPLTVIVPQRPQQTTPLSGVQQTLLKPAAEMMVVRPASAITVSPPPQSIVSSDCGYSSGRDSVSPCSAELNSSDDLPLDLATHKQPVWRPF